MLWQGCNGGQPSGAWSWFSETGVVTGGDQVDENTGSSCLPYPFPVSATTPPPAGNPHKLTSSGVLLDVFICHGQSCAHHVDPTPEHPACPDGDYDTPVCSKSCSDSAYTTSYRADKHMSKDAYSVKGESRIMQEIYERGSVTAALTVYEDFLVYEKGVYTHVSGQRKKPAGRPGQDSQSVGEPPPDVVCVYASWWWSCSPGRTRDQDDRVGRGERHAVLGTYDPPATTHTPGCLLVLLLPGG